MKGFFSTLLAETPMANEEHLALVRRGEGAIREWRQARPRARLDLTGASINQIDLSRANLEGADLTGASLYRSRLAGANLRRANLRGVSFDAVALPSADLTHADLRGANARGVDLSRANLSWAALDSAVISADLSHATLQGASLRDTNLIDADLSDANLSGSYLIRTRFQNSRLSRTDISRVTLNGSIFVDCDLSNCIGLRSAIHDAPSYIGTDTLIASLLGSANGWELRLQTFLIRAGVPRELLEALPRIIAGVEFCSTYISYARPDRPFAEALHENLVARRVPCWLRELDAAPQERALNLMGAEGRDVEKVVVLCSAQALAREAVLEQIAQQIDDAPDKIVPISLDSIWKEPGFRVMLGERDFKPFLVGRQHADFAFTTTYVGELERLLAALRRVGKPTFGPAG